MREFEIKPGLKKTLSKLFKKDKSAYDAVMKKIYSIITCRDVNHYKNLKHELKNLKRVHIGHFVLVFEYDSGKDLVSFEDYDHHDNIYL